MRTADITAPSGADGTDDPLDDLLVRAGRQDAEAFKKLYTATSSRLLGVALRITRRREVAEDALHDAFVRVWWHAARFDPARGPAVGWMITIVRNSAINHLRKTAREAPLQTGEPDDPVDLLDQMAAVPGLPPIDRIGLARCLDELEPMPRQCVVMAFAHGWSHEELADRLGHPLGTVKSWIRRSLARLRECLGG
jgi:RNA polymerase sigma-70 factor (ECF subfamily)